MMADVCDVSFQCDINKQKDIADLIIEAVINIKTIKHTKATAEKVFSYLKKEAEENLDLTIFKYNLEMLVESDILRRNKSGVDEVYAINKDKTGADPGFFSSMA